MKNFSPRIRPSSPLLRKTSLSILALLALLAACVVVHSVREKDFKAAATAVLATAPVAVVGAKPTVKIPAVNAGLEDDFLAAVESLHDQTNAMIAGLPPLEQFEASAELSYGLRSLRSYANSFIESMANMRQRTEAYQQKAKAAAEASAEASLLSTDKYILKADAELAQNQALENQKAQLQSNFDAERTREKTVKERRAELAADAELTKKVPAVAISHINAEVIALDSYRTDVPKYAGRIEKITAAGVSATAETDLLTEIMGLPLDDASEAVVTARCESVKKLIAASASRGNGNGHGSGTAALNAERQPIPAGGGNGGSSSSGPRRIF